jgi:hypothetical protein
VDQKTATPADRVRDRFDDLAGSTMLTEIETAVVLGYAPATLKWWRAKRTSRGPKETYVLGAVRYLVSDIRKWRDSQVKLGAQSKRARPPLTKKPPAIAKPVKRRARA